MANLSIKLKSKEEYDTKRNQLYKIAFENEKTNKEALNKAITDICKLALQSYKQKLISKTYMSYDICGCIFRNTSDTPYEDIIDLACDLEIPWSTFYKSEDDYNQDFDKLTKMIEKL